MKNKLTIILIVVLALALEIYFIDYNLFKSHLEYNELPFPNTNFTKGDDGIKNSDLENYSLNNGLNYTATDTPGYHIFGNRTETEEEDNIIITEYDWIEKVNYSDILFRIKMRGEYLDGERKKSN